MAEPKHPIAIEGLKKALKHQEDRHAFMLQEYVEVYKVGEKLLVELSEIADKRAQIAREIQSLERQV